MIKSWSVPSNKEVPQQFQSRHHSHAWLKYAVRLFGVQFLAERNRLLPLKSRHGYHLRYPLPLGQVARTKNQLFNTNK